MLPEIPTVSRYVKSILACTYLAFGRANDGSSSPASTRSFKRRFGMARDTLSWRWNATPAPESAACSLLCTACRRDDIAVNSSACDPMNAVSCWAQLLMLSAIELKLSSTYL